MPEYALQEIFDVAEVEARNVNESGAQLAQRAVGERRVARLAAPGRRGPRNFSIWPVSKYSYAREIMPSRV